MAEVAEVLEFEIERYKALSSVRIGWSPKVVLFGPNGAGKTSVLEAFTLCFGSQASLWQLARRVEQPEPGALSAVIRCPRWVLPMAPSVAGLGESGERRSGTTFDEYPDAARFWEAIGADGTSDDLDGALRRALGDELGEVLVELCREPILRYRLESDGGVSRFATFDRAALDRSGEFEWPGGPFRRSFSRTLVTEGPPPSSLVDRADELPEAFAPLRRWIASGDPTGSVYVDVMELPPVDRAPVRCVWLASERTSAEAYFDLWSAWEQSAEEIAALARAAGPLADLRLAAISEHDLEYWFLSEIAARMHDTVGMVFDGFDAYADDAHLGALYVELGSRSHVISDELLFERYGSAERVWLDNGLARAVAEVENLIVEVRHMRSALEALPGERLVDLGILLDEPSGGASEPSEGASEYVSPFELARHVMALPDSQLVPADLAMPVAVLTERLTTARSVLTIDVYDEPERHLHPSAQRRLAGRLGSRDDRGVVLATHSHLFLGDSGWQHHYVARPEGRATVTTFDPSDLTAGAEIAHEMGLDRGELLARVEYILFVEGPVDRIVLDGLYGRELTEAGVLVIPIHGVDEALALAETELIGVLVHVGVGFLVDHARRERLRTLTAATAQTKEERVIVDLRGRLKERGRKLDLYGLSKEDIIAYLDGVVMGEVVGGFPGWDEFERGRREREHFKDALERVLGRPLGRHAVKEIVHRMRKQGLDARGDLSTCVKEILDAARARRVHQRTV